MIIGVCGDVHLSKYSSILRSRGEKYSKRIENCTQSINWFESMCMRKRCTRVIYLGDFFDTPELDSEVLTSLNDIEWYDVPHYFLVGNHEMGRGDLSISSSHLMGLNKNFQVIDNPTTLLYRDCNLVFLPYILESNREPFESYLMDIDETKQTLVFSHNDIKDIQMGKFISTTGFTKEEIQLNCAMFVNGHIHNGSWVGNNILNLGNLTGQNFNEDGNEHRALFINTDERSIEFEDNPYAIYFERVECLNAQDLSKLMSFNGSVVLSIKTVDGLLPQVKKACEDNKNILEYRVMVQTNNEAVDDTKQQELYMDHLGKFSEYVHEKLGRTELIEEELHNVLES